MAVEGDWARLSAFVVRDRLAAGYETQAAFAEAIGISLKALGAFERGASQPRRSTLSRIETVLQWVPGSAHRVLSGGEPSYIDLAPRWRTEADLRDVTERDIWKIRGLTDNEKWTYIDLRRERLARDAHTDGAQGLGEDSA